MKKILDDLHLLSFGVVNAYLIEKEDRLILIDTGYPGNQSKDLLTNYFKKIGRSISDITDIIVTHHHIDHAGSLKHYKMVSNAKIYMHKEDAIMVEAGISIRKPNEPGLGFINRSLYRLFIKNMPDSLDSCTVEHKLNDNEIIQL